METARVGNHCFERHRQPIAFNVQYSLYRNLSSSAEQGTSFFHERRKHWSAEERGREQHQRKVAKELEHRTRQFLLDIKRPTNKTNDQHVRSGLFQHLLDWSAVISNLNQGQLKRVVPMLDEMANILMDLAPTKIIQDSIPYTVDSVVANAATVVTVPIHGWAKLASFSHYSSTNQQGSKNATNNSYANKAQALLERLEGIYDRTNNVQYQPLDASYAGVLDAWSKSLDLRAPQKTTALFQHMMALTNNPLATRANARAWNAVLNAWAVHGNADRVMELFQQMQQDGVVPNKYTYSIVTKAWLRSSRPDAARHVHDLLTSCIKRYQEDPTKHPMPTSMQFGTLVKLYAKQPQKGQAVLDELQQWYIQETKHPDLQPQARHYVPLMNAWAKQARPEKVEALLIQMQELYQGGNEKCKPQHRSFVIVIDAWSKRRTPEAAEKAQDILYRMEEIFLKEQGNNNSSDGNIRTDHEMNSYGYNLVMDAHVQNGRRGQIVKNVQNLFKRMERLGRQHRNPQMLPDKVSYTCLMRAQIKDGRPGFEDRVEMLLDEMKHLWQKAGRANVKPDTISYACVLDAFSKSAQRYFQQQQSSRHDDNAASSVGTHHIAERGEAILREMIDSMEQGDPDVSPNEVCFNSMLNIYSKLGKAEEAEQMLVWMEAAEARKDKGQVEVKPTIVSYATCIDAWARSNHNDGYNRASLLMARLLRKHRESQDKRLRPTTTTYCSLLTALSRSLEPSNKVEIALELRDEMDKLGIPQSRVSRNTFLQACSRTTGSEAVVKEALRQAVVSFQAMRSNGAGQQGTDDVTYKIMLHVIDNLMKADDGNPQLEREQLLSFSDLIEKCCVDGHLDHGILNHLQNMVPTDVYKSIVGSKTTQTNELPPAWSRNIRR